MNEEKIKVDFSKIYFKPINSSNEEYKELTSCGSEINNITVTEPLCNEKNIREFKNKQYEFCTTFIFDVEDKALIKVKQVKTKRLKKKYYKKSIYYSLTHEKRW